MKKKTVQVLPHNEVVVGDSAPSPALVAVSDLEFTNPELTKSLFYRSEVTLQLDLGFKGNNNGNFVCDFKDLYNICCGTLTPECKETILLGIHKAIKDSRVLTQEEASLLAAKSLSEISLYYYRPGATIRRYITPRNMAMNFWKKLKEAGVQGDPKPVDLMLYVNFGAFVPTSAPPAPQALIMTAPLTDVRPTPKDDSPDSGITTRDFSGTVHATVNPPHANKTAHADNVEHPDFDDRKPLAVNTPEVPTNKPDDTRITWRGLTVDMSRLVPGNQPPLGTPVVCQKTIHPSDAHGVPNIGHPTRTPNLRTSEGNTGNNHQGAYNHHGNEEAYKRQQLRSHSSRSLR